jgi:hypothetical protein
MTEAGIGRILIASLHQGISDVLPMRLEFYENWLNPDGLRHGTIGLAPLHAVLSFLRQEGEPYRLIARRAGTCAAEWTVASQTRLGRALLRSMPTGLRSRLVLRLAKRTVRRTYAGSRAVLRVSRGRATLDLRDSIFCGVRDSTAQPLCDFYAAMVSRFLELYGVSGDVCIERCRAVGGTGCLISVALHPGRPRVGDPADAA